MLTFVNLGNKVYAFLVLKAPGDLSINLVSRP